MDNNLNLEYSLIGSGGHCKVIIEIIEELGGTVSGIYDKNCSGSLFDYPVLAGVPEKGPLIIAVGSNSLRKALVDSFSLEFATAIHPKSNVSRRCLVGCGTVIMAGATVNSDTVIGTHCIINTNSSVDHDCIIGDYVHVAPNAAIAGGVTVGEGTHIGMGSSIIQSKKIGRWAKIGAGAVVITDIPDYAVVVGVPGRVVRVDNEPS